MRHLHGGPAERRVHTLRPHSDVSPRCAAAAVPLCCLPGRACGAQPASAKPQGSRCICMLCVLPAAGAAAARGSATRAAMWSAQCESHLLLDARAKQSKMRGGAERGVPLSREGMDGRVTVRAPHAAMPPRPQVPRGAAGVVRPRHRRAAAPAQGPSLLGLTGRQGGHRRLVFCKLVQTVNCNCNGCLHASVLTVSSLHSLPWVAHATPVAARVYWEHNTAYLHATHRQPQVE